MSFPVIKEENVCWFVVVNSQITNSVEDHLQTVIKIHHQPIIHTFFGACSFSFKGWRAYFPPLKTTRSLRRTPAQDYRLNSGPNLGWRAEWRGARVEMSSGFVLKNPRHWSLLRLICFWLRLGDSCVQGLTVTVVFSFSPFPPPIWHPLFSRRWEKVRDV